MSTGEDEERRFAQIEGERDYYKRMADRREHKLDKLREALRFMVLQFEAHDCPAVEKARVALKATEEG